MWQPQLPAEEGPLYERIAQALAQDIQAGRLQAGQRLPTLKALAALLGVTPGTVSRAYELAHRRGLVSGEVGRGTFVLPLTAGDAAPVVTPPAPTSPTVPGMQPAAAEAGGEALDLSIVKPYLPLQEPVLRQALAELARAASLPEMLDYTRDGGLPSHRQAGAQWLRAAGLDAQADQIILTAGAQHGLWVAVQALTRPGELVACEALCYPGVASVVLGLGRRLQGIAMDEEGLQVEALRAQCRRERPALVICIANVQNPTTAVMSAARRAELAALAREQDLRLLDDDLYGFLVPGVAPPLAQLAPERTVYLTSLSKSVLPTVRLGYLHAPPAWLGPLTAAVRSTVWMVSPLAAQVATLLIQRGQAWALSQAQREEARARQQLAADVLQGLRWRSAPTSFHLWLELPGQWRSGEQFAALARSHQIAVAAGDAFATDRDGLGRQHVRLCLMPPSRERLAFVLDKLAGLARTPQPGWL
ncbi:aminotransferase-like domain-containing protein [Ideonella livida]|uniref:PLP-dependent aminotransferase family protein n=1 Tax=Ideonella livida TaxID=2707176 RepID=A0A7C9PER6_9BURK|nr:PLP-dependent aminotransferase family protein [Ideonella livida]NDY89630.1 PLP-dependent aminotransferase family protein [Ideonella livida]